jgi:hypothetical protein
MARRIQGQLSASISTRKGSKDAPTTLAGRYISSQSDQILNPHLGARTCQPDRNTSRCGSQHLGEGSGIDLKDLMRHHCVAVDR